MTETSDPQLQLKKRARRRLVGAVAFAGLAAVVLPMVMDEEPKQPVQDIQLRIPGQEQVPAFKPADPPARPAAASSAQVASEPSDTPPATDVAQLPTPTAPAAAAAASVAGTVIAGKAVADKLAEKKSATPPARPSEKKAPEKKPPKPVDRAPSSATTKAHDQPARKPVDKPAPKKADKPADASSEESPRTDANDAQRANALLAGKTPAPVAAPVKGSGSRHMIMVGAFANAENAKQLQARLGSAGVSAYTEELNSPDGKKIRVRAGPFPSREAAEKALEKMKRIGVSGVVASRQ